MCCKLCPEAFRGSLKTTKLTWNMFFLERFLVKSNITYYMRHTRAVCVEDGQEFDDSAEDDRGMSRAISDILLPEQF